MRAAGVALAELSITDAHECVYTLLAQGRAVPPLQYWKHEIERAGIKLPDPNAPKGDTDLYRVEKHGKHSRVTGGKVTDPELFAKAWKAAGW